MRVFKALVQEPDLEWEFIDGSIVKAHQHSTIVMDQGKIIEQGSRSELIALNGSYKNLWDAQSSHSLI